MKPMHYLASMVLALLALLSISAPAHAQRVNLDTGWHPSVDATQASVTPSFAFLVPCAELETCSTARLLLTVQYHYRLHVRNRTTEPARFEGGWSSIFWLMHGADAPYWSRAAAPSAGVALDTGELAPMDGAPGGADETTIDVVVSTPLPPFGEEQIPIASAAPFAVHARGLDAHRMWFRPQHSWIFATNHGSPIALEGHWPFALDVELAEARVFGRVEFLP